jgi:YVTN family beta-propeller protein
VYITNEQSGDLSIIHGGTNEVVATIPLGKRPRGVKVSADGTQLFVALSGSPIAGPGVDESKLPPADKSADGIGIVDIAARKVVKMLHGGSDPEALSLSKDGTKVYTSNDYRHRLEQGDCVNSGRRRTRGRHHEPRRHACVCDLGGRWTGHRHRHSHQ